MAGASNFITVDVDDRQMRHAFEKLELAGQNMQPLFADICEYLLESTKQRFEDQVDPDGLPWAPLKESTRENKKKNNDLILVEHGQLVDSFHASSSHTEVAMGTNDIRAATLHFGDDDRNIPARPMLGVNYADQDVILDLAEAYLLQALST